MTLAYDGISIKPAISAIDIWVWPEIGGFYHILSPKNVNVSVNPDNSK
jgi:hypothetical protein